MKRLNWSGPLPQLVPVEKAIYGWMVDSFLDKVGPEPVNFGGIEHCSAYWPGETNPC
jgi:hypothetical protein